MAIDLGTLAPPPRPRVEPVAGVCRACGCTDAEACELWDQPRQPVTGEVATCSWVERDLCSRCHSPRRPTRPQALELDRIRRRVGPYRLEPGRYPGELVIGLLERAPLGYMLVWQPYRELRMGPDGRIREQRPRLDQVARDTRRDAGDVIAAAERDLEL